MIEIFLSSDGKHTVRASVPENLSTDPEVNIADIKKVYAAASAIYKKILEDHGKGTKMGNVEAEKNLGKCEKCGADMKMSMKGKPYCSAKCWL